MKVALVHDWLVNFAGSENVFREIVDMFPGDIYTSQANPSVIPFLKGRPVHTSFVQRLPMAFSKHYVYAPLMPRIYAGFDLEPYDLVLADSHSFAHHVRPRPDALFICYYYTVARSLWVPEIDPRASSGRLAPIKKMLAGKLRKLDFAAAQRPNVRWAISKTSAERVERFYKVKCDQVIYPPVDTKRWNGARRESEDLGLLIWGRLIDYKRMDLAIQAARITGDKLQIVGKGPDEAKLKNLAEGSRNITFHGRLSDDELLKLMSWCRAVIFPNYEDFGIVPVEAMAAGLPVVAFAQGGAAETVPEDCGVLFHEQTPDALAAAIRALAGRTFDPERLRAQAALFDTERFRQEYRKAVEDAVERHFPAGSP